MHRSTIEGQGLYKDKYMGKISLTKQNNCVVQYSYKTKSIFYDYLN